MVIEVRLKIYSIEIVISLDVSAEIDSLMLSDSF